MSEAGFLIAIWHTRLATARHVTEYNIPIALHYNRPDWNNVRIHLKAIKVSKMDSSRLFNCSIHGNSVNEKRKDNALSRRNVLGLIPRSARVFINVLIAHIFDRMAGIESDLVRSCDAHKMTISYVASRWHINPLKLRRLFEKGQWEHPYFLMLLWASAVRLLPKSFLTVPDGTGRLVGTISFCDSERRDTEKTSWRLAWPNWRSRI